MKKVYYEVRLYDNEKDQAYSIFQSEDSRGKGKAEKISKNKADEIRNENRDINILLIKWAAKGYKDSTGVYYDEFKIEKDKWII